jgi:hypothetical protein
MEAACGCKGAPTQPPQQLPGIAAYADRLFSSLTERITTHMGISIKSIYARQYSGATGHFGTNAVELSIQNGESLCKYYFVPTGTFGPPNSANVMSETEMNAWIGPRGSIETEKRD